MIPSHKNRFTGSAVGRTVWWCVVATAVALWMTASAMPGGAQTRLIAPTASEAEEGASEAATSDAAEVSAELGGAVEPDKGDAREPLPLPEAGRNNGVGRKVYRLRIDTDAVPYDMIDRHWNFRLHRALTAAESAGASAFILEINTNGGRLDAGFMMLARMLDAKVPTYAFINSKAISAGAMVAMGADHIVMRPTGRIGDALPVVHDPESSTGMAAAENKVVSAVASEMRAASQAKGHPQNVAVAMVDPTKPLAGYTKKGELLTMTAREAVEAGLVDYLVDDTDQLLRVMNLEGAEVVTPKLTPLESVAGFFANQAVVFILGIFAVLGVLVEFKTPGIGIPGLIALICFGLMYFGASVANLAGVIEPLLILVGVVLLALEIFVIPGFGLPGITGIACVLLGIGLSTTEMPISTAGIMGYWIAPALYTASGTLVGTIVSFPLLLKMLPYIPYLNQAMLDPKTDPRHGRGPVDTPDLPLRIGMVGVAATILHPAGTAIIEGERYDVVSDGRYIESGTALVIREVRGHRVVVAPRA